jgi:hypothetical protein
VARSIDAEVAVEIALSLVLKSYDEATAFLQNLNRWIVGLVWRESWREACSCSSFPPLSRARWPSWLPDSHRAGYTERANKVRAIRPALCAGSDRVFEFAEGEDTATRELTGRSKTPNGDGRPSAPIILRSGVTCSAEAQQRRQQDRRQQRPNRAAVRGERLVCVK